MFQKLKIASIFPLWWPYRTLPATAVRDFKWLQLRQILDGDSTSHTILQLNIVQNINEAEYKKQMNLNTIKWS
jgi:hypothetical protein